MKGSSGEMMALGRGCFAENDPVRPGGSWSVFPWCLLRCAGLPFDWIEGSDITRPDQEGSEEAWEAALHQSRA